MSHRFLWTLSLIFTIGCGAGPEAERMDEHLGVLGQRQGILPYDASNTNSALDPISSANIPYYLNNNDVVMIATCALTGTADYPMYGDTYLRLYSPGGLLVTYNDNSSLTPGCGLYGSKMVYSVSSTGAGYYNIRAGCYASGSCGGTVAISKRKVAPQSFSVGNTNDATNLNVFKKTYYFSAGKTVRISTCGASSYGASASGDTLLRLYNSSGTQVAWSNNYSGCGSASEIVYTPSAAGYYELRVGCSLNTSCSGVYTIYEE